MDRPPATPLAYELIVGGGDFETSARPQHRAYPRVERRMGCHTRCLIAHKQAHNARKPSRKCPTFLFHSEGRRRRHGDGRQDASRALRARPDTSPGPSDAGRQDAPPARPRRGCCKAAHQLHRHAATAASQRGTKGDLPSRQWSLDVKNGCGTYSSGQQEVDDGLCESQAAQGRRSAQIS